MKTTVMFTTKSGNTYLYDQRIKSFRYIGSALAKEIALLDSKYPDAYNMQSLNGVSAQVGYLYRLGYFREILPNMYMVPEVLPEQVEVAFANTRHICFEATEECNLHCEYCSMGEFYNLYENRMNRRMNYNRAINLLKGIVALRKSSLIQAIDEPVNISFYGGEPLLNFSLLENVVRFANELASNHNTRFTYSMTTNGLLLPKYADFLEKNSFTLAVSFDGDKNSNSFRKDKKGKSSHEQVYSAIKELSRSKSKYFEDNVSIIAVLHKRNNIRGVTEYFSTNFNKKPRFIGVSPVGVRNEMQESFDRHIYQSIQVSSADGCHDDEGELLLFSPYLATLACLINTRLASSYIDYNELLYRNGNELRFPTATCLPFGKKTFLSVNGSLFPCERLSRRYPLGLVSDKSSIGLDYKRVSELYNNLYKKVMDICYGCYNATCSVCLFNLIEMNRGCRWYQSYRDASESYGALFTYLEEHRNTYSEIVDKIWYKL